MAAITEKKLEPQHEHKMSFEISGDDYMKWKVFEQKHKNCLNNFPDVAGAQYEFSFIPSGLGTFVTITCSCGTKLVLSSDLFGNDKMVATQPEEKTGRKFLRRLDNIEKRPSMFLGRKSGERLNAWILGVMYGYRITPVEDALFEMINRVRLRWQKAIEVEQIDDEVSFDLFFDMLEERLGVEK